jgi:hypothetical protein
VWRGQPGRPLISREVRDLIRKMCRENPGWSAPRIRGELLKLGMDIGESSVSKYMVRCRKPPSQTWRESLRPGAGVVEQNVERNRPCPTRLTLADSRLVETFRRHASLVLFIDSGKQPISFVSRVSPRLRIRTAEVSGDRRSHNLLLRSGGCPLLHDTIPLSRGMSSQDPRT